MPYVCYRNAMTAGHYDTFRKPRPVFIQRQAWHAHSHAGRIEGHVSEYTKNASAFAPKY